MSIESKDGSAVTTMPDVKPFGAMLINKEGLSEAGVHKVLYPFSNHQHFVAVVEAAKALEDPVQGERLRQAMREFAEID